MKSSKHLVVLTPGFASGDDDTQSVVFIQNLLRALNKQFPALRISIITFQFPFTSVPYTWNDNDVFPLNGRNSFMKKFITWGRAKRKLKQLHALQKIDAVFCCWLTECSFVGRRFANKNNIPFICWAAGQDARPDNKYLRLLNLKETEVAVIGDHQVEWLKKSGITAGLKIENGVDSVPAEPSMPYSLHVFGAGSLIPLKNYSEFIEIIKSVRDEFPGVKCELAGDGPEKIRLENLISLHGLEHNIKLCGALSHTDVLRKMRESLIFLHPSTYEGNSTVILEAANCGSFILCRPEASLYRHSNVLPYNSVEAAARSIGEIIKEHKVKREGVLFSSSLQQARKLAGHLGLL